MQHELAQFDFADPEIDGIVAFPGVAEAATQVHVPSLKEAPCDQTAEFMRIFEQVSGWELQFNESRASGESHAHTDASHRPEGSFEIVDMSAAWPAKKPTMHRGHCDQLVELFSEIVSKQRCAEVELAKTRSTLAALTTNVGDDGDLIDSFVPSVLPPNSTVADIDSDWVLDQGNDAHDEDSEFIVRQSVDSGWLGGDGVWGDWTVAGSTGIAGDRYLDWSQSQDRMTVFVGRLESNLGNGDSESRLDIIGDSRNFRVSDASGMSTFFLWDRRGSNLRRVETDQWHQLTPGGAIVVATTSDVVLPETIADLGNAASAEKLVEGIATELDQNQRLFVIKYQ